MHPTNHLPAYEFHVAKHQQAPDFSVHILLYNRALKPMLIHYLRREGLSLGETLFNDHYVGYEIHCRVEQSGTLYRLEHLLREQSRRFQA